MKTAIFRSAGGRIRAGVTLKPKRDGRYTITLWEAEVNREVPPSPWTGNFINVADDEVRLPRPNAKNDGRLLECLATVSVPPHVAPARLTLYVVQDGEVLAREHRDIPPNSPAGGALLFIQLEAE